MKVNVVIAGAQKAGTTTLHMLLAQHPAVHMSPVKGTHFFDTESHFAHDCAHDCADDCADGGVDYSAYHAFFCPQPAHRLIGETTPIYSFWEPVARRLSEYNPAMKVVVVLRNPIDRAYSHWNMERSKGREHHSFEDALALEEQRADAARPAQDRHFSYVARGFYARQLERLATYFPADQRLVLRMEDVLNSGADGLEELWRFLGIDAPAVLSSVRANQRAYVAPMAPATRRRLVETFESEIRALEQMLGWDLSSWLADPSQMVAFPQESDLP